MSAKRAILFLLVSVIVVWFVDQRFSHLSFSEPLLVGDLSAIQAKQVDIYVQVTQQLFTLATLMLAGVGLFNPQRQAKSPQDRSWPLVIVAAFTALSMYFGYLSLNATVWMLSRQFFNLQSPYLHSLRLLQFLTFAISVFFFAWFWLTEFKVRGTR
jgi:hypothetical protein